MDSQDWTWAVGIEDTFIGHPSGKRARVLDEYALIDRDDRLRRNRTPLADRYASIVAAGAPQVEAAA